MFNNYFLLVELTSFLKKEILNKTISSVFSQEKNKFVISLSDDSCFLEFSNDKELPYLIFKKEYSKAKKNVADIFSVINNLKIIDISIYNNDRIICFSFNNNYKIFFILFTHKSNCIIIKDNIVIDAFKNRDELINKPFEKYFKIPEKEYQKNPLTVKDYFKKNLNQFGDIYFKEILYNLKINQTLLMSDIIKDSINSEEERIKKGFINPEYLFYSDNDNQAISLTKLNYLSGIVPERFSNINDLLSYAVRNVLKNKNYSEKKVSVLKSKENILNGIEKKINSLKKQIINSEKSDLFKVYGQSILNNINLISKGDKELMVDYGNEALKLRIPLNPLQSPSDNAQKYFEKYKRQKNSIALLKEKMKINSDKYYLLKKEIENIENDSNSKRILNMEKEIEKSKDSDKSKFRIFVLESGFEVWVGKDSASNDLLTTKFTSQNDLWFHVRGASGSHTVLKINDKKNIPDKKVIESAASIAAYYSKARNASNVPVAYCEKKYVKKKKGFKQGSVVMEREKVIFVKPNLPNQSF